MRYEKTIFILKKLEDRVKRYMSVEPVDESSHEFGEDQTITLTASFLDGVEMDIKCCGVEFREGESNLAWAEAVPFKNGAEVCCSEPVDEPGLTGEWYLVYDGVEYVTRVMLESEDNSLDDENTHRFLLNPQPIIDNYGMCYWRDCEWMKDGLGFPQSGIEDHMSYYPGQKVKFNDEMRTIESISVECIDGLYFWTFRFFPEFNLRQSIIAYEQYDNEATAIAINIRYSKPQLDVVSQFGAAAKYFVTETEAGRKMYEQNCRNFNWGDFVEAVPNNVCKKFGFVIESHSFSGMLVDLNEQLVDADTL